jgi:hypothetical protein
MGNILWLASYPKSGNTWLRAFLHNLMTDPDEPVPINKLAALTQGDSQMAWYEAVATGDPRSLDAAGLAALRPAVHRHLAGRSPDTVIVKTHNALCNAHGIPTITRELTAGAIYIARNPLDVAVSYADHLGQGLDAVIELMARDGFETPPSEGNAPEHHGDWSSHVASWTGVPHPAFHVVRYEDLIATPLKRFAAIVQFMGMEISRERLSRAIKFSSFRTLRAQEDSEGFIERTPAQERFFRRGKSGGWRKVLSRQQVDRMVGRHRSEMERFDYVPRGL